MSDGPISLADFLPKYPNIENFDNERMNPYPDFYESILKKEEFYSLRLPTQEPPVSSRGEFYRHQETIKRYLSAHTLYDAILLVHEMGTGKSGTAFATIEGIKHTPNSPFKGALVLTRGDILAGDLMRDLVHVYTKGEYVPKEPGRKLTGPEMRLRMRKLVSAYYSFHTFDKFTKDLSKMDDATIRERYSNLIIFIDEAHGLRMQSGKASDSRIYRQVHRLCHVAENTKIILSTGTPMKDTPAEIATVMNIILPMDMQMPTGPDFLRAFMREVRPGVFTVRPEKKSELKEYFRGRVSFLKLMVSDLRVEYMGSLQGEMRHLRTVPVNMSAFQGKAYLTAFQQDMRTNKDLDDLVDVDDAATSGIYSKSRQATLFVFPDGSSGQAGFNKYMRETKNPRNPYTMTQELVSALAGNTPEETLVKIRKCSATYANIIENVLKSPDEIHFVYDSLVNGSGSIVLGELFTLFKFRRAIGSHSTKEPRFAVLSNATATKGTARAIIEQAIAPANKNGAYIRVIIGSRIISEGITFKNVQNIYLATPYWNYSELAQAIARGIRLGAHNDLLAAGTSPVVRVYQYVAVPPGADGLAKSIDYIMYNFCDKKDESIKSVERCIKEAAVDCALFYERNKKSSAYDGTRECEYMNCDYRCDGISSLTIPPRELDYSTSNLYYTTDVQSRVLNVVSDIFTKRVSVHLDEILDRVKASLFITVASLKKIITENIPLAGPYGLRCYLREQSNMYFVVDSISTGPNFFASEYLAHPVAFAGRLFEDVMNTTFMQELLERISRATTVEEFGASFENLTLDYRQVFIRTVLEVAHAHPTNDRIEIALDYFKERGIYVNATSYRLGDIVFCRENNTWAPCGDAKPASEELLSINPLQALIDEENLQPIPEDQSPFGYYGYIAPGKNGEKVFCIKRLLNENVGDTRRIPTGRNCITWKIPELLRVIAQLQVPFPEDAFMNTSDAELTRMLSRHDFEDEFMQALDRDGLRRLAYFSRNKKELMCDSIRDFMKANNVLGITAQCGRYGALKKKD